MEDIILMEFLKKKGLVKDYSSYIADTEKKSECADIYEKFFEDFAVLTKNMKGKDKDEFVESLKHYKMEEVHEEGHFTETEAKEIVAKMWSEDNLGRKIYGEKFSMHKVKDICMRYKEYLYKHVSEIDVYLAVNSHYHDYHKLYKKWFGDHMEHQLIESAIAYWFKDADYTKGCKVLDYFKQI